MVFENNDGSKKQRNQRNSATSSFPHNGKLPPQDVEVEKVILGTIIDYPNHIITVIDLLKKDIFYIEANQIICEAILKLHAGAHQIDMFTVMDQLKKSGQMEIVGGQYYFIELGKNTNTYSLHDHIRLVYDHYLLREQIRFFTQKIAECYELSNPFDMISETTNFLDGLQQGTMTKSEVSTAQLATEAIKDREMNQGVRKPFIGVSTGFETLDKAISGLVNEQLIVIAARPAMGKTAFVINLLKFIGMRKEPVALFSLEMSGQQIYTRLQSSVSEIDSKKIRYNDLTEQEHFILNDTDGELSNCPIYIDDTPALNIDRFRAKVTIMKHKYGIKVAMIDYMQLMKGSKNHFNTEAEISEISGKLKQVAKELKIPIIALSQLSRDVEKRGGSKIPMLSDLRHSGSIEQDADVVMFLWRPSYYDFTGAIEFRHFNMDIMPEKLLTVVVAKQREGDTYNIPLHIKLNTMQIEDHPALSAPHMESSVQATLALPPGDWKSMGTRNPDIDEDDEPF